MTPYEVPRKNLVRAAVQKDAERIEELVDAYQRLCLSESVVAVQVLSVKSDERALKPLKNKKGELWKV